jgi:hypothetical protein
MSFQTIYSINYENISHLNTVVHVCSTHIDIKQHKRSHGWNATFTTQATNKI